MSSEGRGPQTSGIKSIVIVVAAAIAVVGSYMFINYQAQKSQSGFMRACVYPDTPTDKNCSSKEEIAAYFGVNVDEVIERERAMMASTVQRILSGELKQMEAYYQCLERGECARVPLLPENSDLTQVVQTNEYLDTRKAFWQLSEDKDLTPEICTFITTCDALRRTGLITF